RNRQHQHRHQRRGNRRRLRRRKGDRRRARIGKRRLESVHAAPDQHHQLVEPVTAGAGDSVPALTTVRRLMLRVAPYAIVEFGKTRRMPPPVLSREDELYWLALKLIPGLGARTSGKLLERLRTPQAIFRASRSELEAAGASGAVAQSIVSGCAFD